jgi:nucleoside phosphorylase
MSGICAGRRGDVALGDVIIGDRLWSYDAGKRKVISQGKRTSQEVFQGDQIQFRLSAAWKQRGDSFQVDPAAKWLVGRPALPLENQEWWLLLALLRGEDPRNHPKRLDFCPDWPNVLPRLRRKGLLTKSGLALTEEGRHEAEEFDLLHIDGIPAPAPFRVHVAPIATGAEVTEDAGIFPRLAENMRKVMGVEMEASAIGAIGKMHDIPALVVKGVSDFGDEFKDDRYRHFAARASAECLLSVLRDGADLI